MFDNVVDRLLERLSDKEANVRIHAAAALSRLQVLCIL